MLQTLLPGFCPALGTFCLLSLPLGTLLLLSILVFLIRILPFFALLSLALSCSQHFAYLVGMFFPLKLVYISLPSNLSLKSPVQVRCTILDAWAWCTGTIQRDGMGREEGGGRREEGSGWGTHVYLWRIHFDIWQNQYNIVKFKNKIKLKNKK